MPYKPWAQSVLDPLVIDVPNQAGLALLRLKLLDKNGNILHRNFMHFSIDGPKQVSSKKILSISPSDFTASDWTGKQWNVMQGEKVNGTGTGFFTYEFDISNEPNIRSFKNADFRIEMSAKELFVKDREEFDQNQNYMKGSRVSPSSNPNAYPMTDETFFPSDIIISINGEESFTGTLPDDPADHRGVLSWHNQLKDRTLHEAGSYGYLIDVRIPRRIMRNAIKSGKVEVQIKSSGGGIAVYGKDFGRYPLDPCIVLSN